MKIGIKTLLQYLLFVGFPLLGVLGALGIGRNLSAPAAVHGTWALAIPQQPALQCQVFTGWNGEMQMAISQSGPDLIIVFSDKAHTALTGSLTGLSISAATGSGAVPQRQLTADVYRMSEPNRMGGSLLAMGCDTPLNFSAELLTSGATGQEH
jgi:hypothetical protein